LEGNLEAKKLPMIDLFDVHKTFAEPLLSGITLNTEPGSIWGLIGPAASGKSVLLKMICGLLDSDAGRITVGGACVSDPKDDAGRKKARAQIGMVFQNNALFDFMSVLKNVSFPLERIGTPTEQAEARAAERLRAVGLAGSEHKMPSQLSGGMKKRVGVARASVTRPKVVLYDEPTAGLDPVTTSKIYDLLREDQKQSGATVIAVSSDVDGLRTFVSQLAVLHDGRLRYAGAADEVEQCDDPMVRQFIAGELSGPL
jgi:phospholipid/cholesterol/gamma-HCH transport system ATP-binding protein